MKGHEFWDSSERRRYIRDYARSLRASPDAVMGAVLARVATVVPPNVVVPAFVGSQPSPLSIYVAVVGSSGSGKGLAEGVARSLIPDLLGATETLPVSGEGLVAMFAGRRPIPGNEEQSELYCVNQRALLSVPEISGLGAVMKRQGNTVESTLLSLWSGEPQGGYNKDESKRLRAPAYGYKLNLIAGVQPAKMDIITDEDGNGFPQRFLWCSTMDDGAPRQRPPKPSETFGFKSELFKQYQPFSMTLNDLYRAGARDLMQRMENGNDPYPLHELMYPNEVAKEVDDDAYRRLHRQHDSKLDTHRLLLTIRIAGLLALLEQRDNPLEVTLEDWQAARWFTQHSVETRERCMDEARSISNGKKAERIASSMASKEKAQQLISERRQLEREDGVRHCIEWIPGYLQNNDPNRVGVPEGTLRNAMTKSLRPYMAEALTRLEERREIERRKGQRGGVRYALAGI